MRSSRMKRVPSLAGGAISVDIQAFLTRLYSLILQIIRNLTSPTNG